MQIESDKNVKTFLSIWKSKRIKVHLVVIKMQWHIICNMQLIWLEPSSLLYNLNRVTHANIFIYKYVQNLQLKYTHA